MRDGNQQALIEWRPAGDIMLPVSRQFDDPYFSLDGGLAEASHVFVLGNHLQERFRPGFRIAELGFGTGLNLCAALIAWRASGTPGPLHFTSFEAYPMTADQMARALNAFPEARGVAGPVLAAWAQGHTRIATPDLLAKVILGDARKTLAGWHGHADAWFLDGFSPAKNPELWGASLMQEVARHTAPDGTFATYTAAGHVRRALAAAGFEVERRSGYGRKRHMTAGRLVQPA